MEHVLNIGKGSFGSAELMFNKIDFSFSVYKFIDNKFDVRDEILNHNFVSEHENIITLKSFGTYKDYHYIEMEYAENGDLFKYIKKNGNQSEDSIRFFMKHIFNAIEHCHDSAITHCDIKLENILLDKNNIPKLTDFGYSKFKITPKKHVGTLQYMAPELFYTNYDISNKIDIYACGVCMYTLFYGRYPFIGKTDMESLRNIMMNKYRINYENTSSEFIDLLERMFETDPDKRITVTEIKDHPWFNL